MKNTKVAVLGYGGMGSAHTRMLEKYDTVECAGVFDIDPKKNALARENGLKVYDSFDAMLSDPEVDAVTVAVPNDAHLECCVRAMDAKKHVVCEKPVAMSHEDLEQMLAASKRNNVIFTVHQNRRWDSDYRIVQKLVDENTLGKVFCIESRVHGSRGIPGDWRNKKECGGGMILDWGIHLFDQMFLIAGDRKLKSIYATLSYVTNEECDDGFKVIAQFEDDLQFHVEVGTSNFINLPRWYVLGENGSAVIEDWKLNGHITMVSDWENRDAVPVETAAGWTKTMAPRTKDTITEYPLPEVESNLSDFYQNLGRAIKGEEPQLVKHFEVMRTMKFMEAVFESAEKNKVITEFDF